MKNRDAIATLGYVLGWFGIGVMIVGLLCIAASDTAIEGLKIMIFGVATGWTGANILEL